MTSINNYRLFCVTENTYVTSWGIDEPTTCPNNTAHTIDPTATVITQTISENKRVIENGVPGSYQSTTVVMPIPVGTPGDITTLDITFPCDIYIWTCEFVSDSSMVGDEFTVIVAPNTVVGVLTAPATIGATTITVNNTIFGIDYGRGVDIAITDGVNTQEVGRITNLDETNLTIEFETPLNYNFGPMSQILLNVHLIRHQKIYVANHSFLYGKKGFSARMVTKGYPFHFEYVNNTGTAKTLHFDMEYNYQ